MRSIVKMLVVASAISIHSLPVTAEPGPTVRTLMNTPVSALSFGLYRADEFAKGQLKTLQHHANFTSAFAFYDWNQNRIQLHYHSEDNLTEDSFGPLCKKVLDQLRRQALFAKKMGVIKASVIAEYFTPIGYDSKDSVRIRAELDKITHLVVTAGPNEGPQTCDGSLLGDGYSIQKK